MTANQRYKQSGSKLPFIAWLKEEQKSGNLKTKEKMLNLTGNQKKSVVSMRNTNIIGIASVLLLGYGLYQARMMEGE